MHTILTICSAVILCAQIWIMQITVQAMQTATRAMQHAEKIRMSLLAERDRVTVNEREIEALRRELRKLSGKFYATQREIVEEAAVSEPMLIAEHTQGTAFCLQYEIAQKEGPFSDAAKCTCNYCTGRRAAKDAFRERQRDAGHLSPQWVRDHSTGTGNHGE